MKEKYTRVSAYGLVVHDAKILLCRISKQLPRWQGQWTLPGGGIDFGEPPAEAAAREIMEETGIHAKIIKPATVCSVHDDSGTHNYHGIQIIYHTTYVSGEPTFEIDGTTDYCQWFDIQEAKSLDLVDLVKIGLDFVADDTDG